LFTHTNLKISFKTNTSIKHQLKPKIANNGKYTNSGIYQLKYHSCQLKYIGETRRAFKAHFKEHIQAIKNDNKLMYVQHTLNTGYSYSYILHIIRRGIYMKKSDKFPIQNSLKQGDIFITTAFQLCFGICH
jgi:hypothetical protein